MSLLSKILNYELKVFEEYLSNRKVFIEKIEKIETNNMNKNQLLIFIENIKNVIDPLKSSIHSMENFDQFDNSFDTTTFIQFYFLFESFFRKNLESLLDDELIDPRSSDPSDPSESSESLSGSSDSE